MRYTLSYVSYLVIGFVMHTSYYTLDDLPDCVDQGFQFVIALKVQVLYQIFEIIVGSIPHDSSYTFINIEIQKKLLAYAIIQERESLMYYKLNGSVNNSKLKTFGQLHK